MAAMPRVGALTADEPAALGCNVVVMPGQALTSCAVPGCDHPDVDSRSGFCPVHSRLLWDFNSWLYGWAVEHFDADVAALERSLRRRRV
jgi:hypothetical protein